MASTDPITGARIGDMNDGPLGGLYLAGVVTDLRTYTTPRFATTGARDAAYAAAGVAIRDGMQCWTDDAGFWDRTGGAWVLRTSPARLRVTSNADADVASTNHPFQVGPDNGQNLVMTPNGFVPRNNGSLSAFGVGGARIYALGTPTGPGDAATKGYVDGTSGTLPLIGGWGVLSGYHTPAYTVQNGWVTLSGAVVRTAASFALGTGTPFQFATLPSSLVPVSTISPLTYVGIGTGAVATWSARLYCIGGSTNLSIVGMDSGSGTMAQNTGYINLDGVTWRV